MKRWEDTELFRTIADSAAMHEVVEVANKIIYKSLKYFSKELVEHNVGYLKLKWGHTASEFVEGFQAIEAGQAKQKVEDKKTQNYNRTQMKVLRAFMDEKSSPGFADPNKGVGSEYVVTEQGNNQVIWERPAKKEAKIIPLK